MAEYIAYCGLDCTKCDAYIGTQEDDAELLKKTVAKWSDLFEFPLTIEDILCDSCKSESDRKCAYVSQCKIRACAIEKDVEECAFCDEYPCEMLEEFLEFAPYAKETLDNLRN